LKKLVLFSLSILIFGAASSQGMKYRKAEKLFANYSYSEAKEIYLELDSQTTHVNRRLAECNRLLHNNQEAVKFYSTLVNSDSAINLDYYYYSQMLKAQGQYEEAKTWMTKYSELAEEDSRAQLHSENSNYVNDLLVENKKYSVSNLAINSEQQDFGPTLYKGKVVFASSREGSKPIERKWNWNGLPFLDLYVAEIKENGDLINEVQLHKKINSKFHEGPASFNQSGSYMVYTQNIYHDDSEDNVIGFQLMSSNFNDGEWSEGVGFHFNNHDYSVGHPSLSPDAKTLYFSSDMPGGFGSADIYRTTLNDDGTWGSPENLGKEVNTEGNEMFPYFHPSGLLYFSSNGRPGLGGLDLFVTKLENGNATRAENLAVPFNSSGDDFSIVLDSNLTHGYFSSNRKGGHGSDDLYYFERDENLAVSLTVIVLNKKTGEVLPNSQVIILKENGSPYQSLETNDKGEITFKAKVDSSYSIAASKESYSEEDTLYTQVKTSDEEVTLNLVQKLYAFAGITVDEETKKIIKGVHIKLYNLRNDSLMYDIECENGDFYAALPNAKRGDSISYRVTISAEGYLNRESDLNIVLQDELEINIFELDALSFSKIEVGSDINSLIEINPIYFDLNKSDIRKDASIELDKIVEVLKNNPEIKIELGSHTDSRGSDTYNLKLSDRRAKSSAKYITSKGIAKDRITGIGYGETKLRNQCSNGVKCSKEEHAQNRRTEFKITEIEVKLTPH